METETFQHYRILRRDDGSLWVLGRGALAVTYKAFDTNLRRSVALKVFNAFEQVDAHSRAQFVREAGAAAALNHRNIAGVHPLGYDGQNYFYATEFVEGETVEELVTRRGPLPPAEALGIAAQVARALGAAAERGLVHRDIKPANLMVVPGEDGSLLVKVIDFGLVRRAVADPSAEITLSGFAGTPQYISPEQVEERDLDNRSDIYSLGVTLWYLLAGQPTFVGPTARLGSQHLEDEPPWTTVGHLPGAVRVLLAHMLQKNPDDRPQDPTALQREIESCQEALKADPSVNASVRAGTLRAKDVGTERLREGDGSGDETVGPSTPNPAPEGWAPAAGELFARRYHLLEAVGEGRAGRVFRAWDARAEGRLTAIKILRPGLPMGQGELQALRDDVHRLHAVPHPRLIEVFALDHARGQRFMASEWINGFTLVDLLRRRGRLDLTEALRLLEHASDAATHGRANGLRHLELAPHQVLVHFPEAFDGDKARAVRTLVSRPLARWPEFGLKIDALSLARETGHDETWTGAVTLVPSARPPERTRQSGLSFPPEEGYFHALAALLYEMLSGNPPTSGHKGSRGVSPLPCLGEKGNGLLQRALSAEPGFRDEREFFNELLAVSGLERADLRFGQAAGERFSTLGSTYATVVPGDSAANVVISAPPPSSAEASARGRWSERALLLVTAALAGIVVAALVISLILWSKHLSLSVRKESPTASPVSLPR